VAGPERLRRFAADFACRESALCEAALRGSRLSAFNPALERFEDEEDFFFAECPLR
jgi:hypothetical protein